MKALSLFSGIGGIDLACEWAGIETVAFCEREPFCQKVLRKHWPHVPIYDDVCTLSKEVLDRDGIGPIDLIHGGYPCQPFSTAGKRQGEDDDRHLWPEVFRLIQEIRPRWFVGENVAGHITLGLDVVLADLESVGYTAEPVVLPACGVGAPQRRARVFILAYSESVVQRRLPFGTTETNTGFTFGDKNVADSAGGRCGEKGKHSERSKERTPGGGEVLANTCSESGLQTGSTVGTIRSEWFTWNDAGRRGWRYTAGGGRQTSESGVGGMLDGISTGMDADRWPAAWGQKQKEWEPPRVAAGIKNRDGRLKALGNAVVPQQINPILAAIRQIDDMVQMF